MTVLATSILFCSWPTTNSLLESIVLFRSVHVAVLNLSCLINCDYSAVFETPCGLRSIVKCMTFADVDALTKQ